jgi:hypothetical protein
VSLMEIEELEDFAAPSAGSDFLDGWKIGAALAAALIAGFAAT